MTLDQLSDYRVKDLERRIRILPYIMARDSMQNVQDMYLLFKLSSSITKTDIEKLLRAIILSMGYISQLKHSLKSPELTESYSTPDIKDMDILETLEHALDSWKTFKLNLGASVEIGLVETVNHINPGLDALFNTLKYLESSTRLTHTLANINKS